MFKVCFFTVLLFASKLSNESDRTAAQVRRVSRLYLVETLGDARPILFILLRPCQGGAEKEQPINIVKNVPPPVLLFSGFPLYFQDS